MDLRKDEYLVVVGIWAVFALMIATLFGGVLALQPPSTPANQGGFRFEFNKTGGIAGVNDTLIIRDDGLAIIRSRFGVSFNGTVGAVQFSELKHVIARNLDDISPKTLQARAEAADYFAYRLMVTNNTKTSEITWVDEWAVNGTLPEALKVTHLEVQKLATDLTTRQSFANKNFTNAGGLRMTILTDFPSYELGGRMKVVAILENVGSSNVTYTSPTPCSQDIRLVVSNGTMIQSLETDGGAGVCIQVLQMRTLQPYTYILQSGTWDLTLDQNGKVSVSPGRYTVSAVFPFASFEKQLVSSSVEVSVATSVG